MANLWDGGGENLGGFGYFPWQFTGTAAVRELADQQCAHLTC
jgi:hypothetical protein